MSFPRTEVVLTRADAVAWLGLKREVKGWRKGLMILWFAVAGIALAFMPETWVGAQGDMRHWIAFALVFAAQFALMTLFLSVKLRWDARRLIPVPVKVSFQDRGDELAGFGPDGSPLTLTAETISQIIQTPTHLFFSTPGSVLILPARIFRHPQDKERLALKWLDRINQLDDRHVRARSK